MRKQQSPKNFVISLEDNAFNSLEHGIEHYLEGSNKDLKFTVLHVFHALELLLKARLAKAHPLLVLQKPEEDPQKGYTVDYFVMLKRLKNVGVAFSDDDTKSLEYLRSARNAIEHYHFEANRSDIEDYVARTMKLLDRFVEKELNIHLKERISEEVYRAMEIAVYSFEERQERIQGRIADVLPRKLKEQLDYQRMVCDECGEDAVLVPDPNSEVGEVHCYACDARFSYWICNNCGTPILKSPSSRSEGNGMCDACWDDLLSRD
jgi:hypothetical protein